MEKTPEELKKDTAERLRRADEIERVHKKQQPASPGPQTKSNQATTDVPDPATGFYPRKPKRHTFDGFQICSDPDKKTQDKD